MSFGTSFQQISMKYLVTVTLNQYLSWMISFKKGENIEHISILLELLNFILFNPNIIQVNNGILLISSTIYYLFDFYFNYISFNDLFHIINPFISFFLNNSFLPKNSYELIYKLIQIILKDNLKIYNLKILYLFQQLFPIFKNFHYKMSPYLIDNISKLLYDGLINLDEIALQICINLISFFGHSCFIYPVKEIPNSIFNIISKNDPIIKFPDNFPEIIKLINIKTIPIISNWNCKSTFDQPIDINYNPKFSKKKDLSILIHSEVLNKIPLILSFIQYNNILLDTFITSFSSILCLLGSNSYIFDISSILIYIFMKIPISNFDNSICRLIINSSIFDPKITFHFDFLIFSNLDIIRTLKLDFLFKFDNFYNIFLDFHIYPLLYSELCFRIIKNLNDFISIFEKNKNFPNFFSKEIQYYRLHNNIDELTKNQINQARLSQFSLLDKLLLSERLSQNFFNDISFCSLLLSLLLENFIRKFILNILLNYLKTENGTKNQILLTSLISITKESFYEVSLTEPLEFYNDIIYFYSSLIYFTPIYILSLLPFLVNITEKLLNIQFNNHFYNFIINSLDFFILTSNLNKISQSQLISIESSIIKYFDINPPIIILNKLLILSSSSKNTILKNYFIIKQPKLFISLIKLFSNSTLFDSLLEYIYNICYFSDQNCIILHENCFEIPLLNLINEWNSINNDKTHQVNLILKIFSKISNKICSVAVCQKFIELFTPINEKYLPNYFTPILNYFNNNLMNTFQYPNSYIPLTNTVSFIINGFNESLITNNFNFGFWIYLLESKTTFTILTIKLSNLMSFSCFIENSFIKTFLINSSVGQWEGSSHIDIPLNKWTFINFNIIIDANINHIIMIASLNSDQFRRMTFPFFAIPKGQVSIVFGEYFNNSNSNIIHSYLGPFGIYKNLSYTDIDYLNEIGPRNMSILNNYEYLFISYIESNFIYIDSLPSNNELNIQYNPFKNNQNFTFIDIFSYQIGFSVLLPLLNFADYTFKNGNNYPDLIEIIINSLNLSFSLSNHAQKEFFLSNGFQLLAYILINIDKKHITNRLYMLFFEYVFIIKNDEILFEFFKFILLNLEIWYRSNFEDHEKIINHWVYSLYPSFKLIFLKLFSFIDILSILRVYYYYESIEEGLIRIRNIDLHNLDNIRDDLIFLSFSFVNKSISSKEIEILIDHILTLSDQKQIFHLLNLVSCIINNNYLEENINFNCILQLLNLLNQDFNDNIIKIIKICLDSFYN